MWLGGGKLSAGRRDETLKTVCYLGYRATNIVVVIIKC